MKIPCVKKPCKNCPFRKDAQKGWLGADRVRGLLEERSFLCHKNTELQCAGHMIMKKDENSIVATAKSFNMDIGLKGADLVFESENDCIEHHRR